MSILCVCVLYIETLATTTPIIFLQNTFFLQKLYPVKRLFIYFILVSWGKHSKNILPKIWSYLIGRVGT